MKAEEEKAFLLGVNTEAGAVFTVWFSFCMSATFLCVGMPVYLFLLINWPHFLSILLGSEGLGFFLQLRLNFVFLPLHVWR